MPEAPELQVAVEFLGERLPGQAITAAQVLKPSVVRSLQEPLPDDVVGREFVSITRRGKFLILSLSGDNALVINPKLTGGIQFVPHKQRALKKTCVKLSLSGGNDLRYVDDRQMGQFYYVPNDLVETVPGLADQGPDVLEDFSFDDFRANLKGFSGEIKGVLTRGRVIAGIGNAITELRANQRITSYCRRCQPGMLLTN